MLAPRLDNQHQRGDVPRAIVRLRDAHGLDVHRERWQHRRATEPHRPADRHGAGSGQRGGHQARETELVVRRLGPQHPIPVRHPVAVRRMPQARSLAARIRPRRSRLNDADPRVVEQAGHGRALRLGANERLADLDELADLRRQPREHGDLGRPPTARGNRMLTDTGAQVTQLVALVELVLVAALTALGLYIEAAGRRCQRRESGAPFSRRQHRCAISSSLKASATLFVQEPAPFVTPCSSRTVENLKRQLAAYRVVFKQPRQEELVTLLDRAGVINEHHGVPVERRDARARPADRRPFVAEDEPRKPSRRISPPL